MKKLLTWAVGTTLLLSSCGTYESTGAYTGGQFGSILGSAIGGLTGGPRGSDLGTIVGMAGGAVVGSAIGKQADRRASRTRDDYPQPVRQPTGSYVAAPASTSAAVEIRQADIVDENRDGRLSRGETARVVFEIYNHSNHAVYNVQPAVAEVSGNKHVHISENILVESIPPRQGVRYTAMVRADGRLRDGRAVIRVGVFENGREVTSETRDFTVPTQRR